MKIDDAKRPYPLTMIPQWCGMAPDDHYHIGGCWGILYEFVSKQGEPYCKGCDLYKEPTTESVPQS